MKTIQFRNGNGFPPTICIQLLKWCNLTCINCRAGSSPLEKEILSIEQLSSLLQQLKKYGSWRISLTGGEPFFWKKLPELLTLINDCDYPFSVTTNGFSSEKMFDTIDPSLWKNGTLCVSLDGDQTLHDAYRAEGSYVKALQFIKHSRGRVPKINVNTVLFSEPLSWYKDLYHDLVDAKIDNWTIISPVKAGRRLVNRIDQPGSSIYQDWYDLIKAFAASENRLTTTFLDFAATESVQEDVVFINSDGTVRLPGKYDSEGLPVRQTHLAESQVAETIANCINNSLAENHYMR